MNKDQKSEKKENRENDKYRVEKNGENRIGSRKENMDETKSKDNRENKGE